MTLSPTILPTPGAPSGPDRSLRLRLLAWQARRHRPTAAHRLGHRNVYILPTAAGWVFAALLAVLLVASINYRLGLGHALTFLLAGVGFASIGMTHAHLRGLTLRLRADAEGCVGQPADLTLQVDNPGPVRLGVAVGLRMPGDASGGRPAPAELAAQACTPVQLRFTPTRRGWNPVPEIVVETRYPFGLMRAWSVWRPAAQVLAAPRPEQPAPPLPRGAAKGSQDAGRATTQPRAAAADVGFEGLRPWRHGDTPRRVAWRKLARSGGHGPLASRDDTPPAAPALWLDLPAAAAAGPDAERRLERLAAWVQAAAAQGRPCGLRLPGLEIAPADGEAHRRVLLRALALHPVQEPGASRAPQPSRALAPDHAVRKGFP
jgi:uncharacterized protein (DUF58 family)